MPAKEPEQDPLEGHPVFEKLKFINSGSFGYVILARNKVSGEQVAIKFVEVKYVLENYPISLAMCNVVALRLGSLESILYSYI